MISHEIVSHTGFFGGALFGGAFACLLIQERQGKEKITLRRRRGKVSLRETKDNIIAN